METEFARLNDNGRQMIGRYIIDDHGTGCHPDISLRLTLYQQMVNYVSRYRS